MFLHFPWVRLAMFDGFLIIKILPDMRPTVKLNSIKFFIITKEVHFRSIDLLTNCIAVDLGTLAKEYYNRIIKLILLTGCKKHPGAVKLAGVDSMYS